MDTNSIILNNLAFELCLSKAHIQARLEALAKEIYTDYHQQKPCFVVVLKGAFFFAHDFLRAYPGDYWLDFVQISSYQGHNSSGEVSLSLSPSLDLAQKDIIIIEDIVDTGLSLGFLYQKLAQYKPKSIKCLSLLAKTQKLKPEQMPDYLGFAIENNFVVGYGLDDEQQGRNLPNIYQLITEN